MAPIHFNLQQSIDLYIKKIKAQGSITNSDAQELMTHLFDATASLKATGLSDEEAFIIASKRLGKEELLSEEYSKVNASINSNKVWAYLCIGFNWVFCLYTLFYIGIALFYKFIYDNKEGISVSSLVVTAFHILICVITWYAVSQKTAISKFIERQVNSNSIRTVFLSFVLLAFVFVLSYNLRRVDLYHLLFYPDINFNRYAEFTFYIMFLNFALAVLSIVFTINKPGRVDVLTLFEKPSLLFLIVFGIIVELIAACTRAIREEVFTYAAFGLIYLFAALLISYHNKANVKSLIIFSLFGFLSETIFGTMADLSRGNTYFTVFFVGALMTGILMGRYIGSNLKKDAKALV